MVNDEEELILGIIEFAGGFLVNFSNKKTTIFVYILTLR